MQPGQKLLFRLVLFVFPFLLLLPSVFYFFNNSIVLFPNPSYANQIEGLASFGSEIVNFDIMKEQINFSFILKPRSDNHSYQYASLVIWLKSENRFFDLRAYDSINFKVKETEEPELSIFIKTFEPGVSEPERFQAVTLRHHYYLLSMSPDVKNYRINIKDFMTPDWWFEIMDIPLEERRSEDYSMVSALDFQFIYQGEEPLDDSLHHFVVEKIWFQKSYPVFYIVLNSIALIYLFFIIYSLLFKRIKIINSIFTTTEQEIKLVPYKQLELASYADEDLNRIMLFIQENYSNPEMSSAFISQETGISRSRIGLLLKESCGCTAKQLVNQIRLTEAKRLLKTTDRLVLEIALEVGYNDISTFNRCFKQQEKKTPREYRGNSKD